MDFSANRNIIKRSVIVRNVFVFLGFGVVVAALLYYQVINSEFYKTRAIRQQTLDTEITAKSGTVYDRNYSELAVSTDTETITLKHEAHSRSLFAEGAIVAAAFLMGRGAGMYEMRDMVP